MKSLTASEILDATGLTADELLDRLCTALSMYCIEENYAPIQTQMFLAALRAQADRDMTITHLQ